MRVAVMVMGMEGCERANHGEDEKEGRAARFNTTTPPQNTLHLNTLSYTFI